MDALEFLPVELWVNILDFTCQNPNDTASMTKVCRLFHHIVSNLPIFQRLHCKVFPVANFSLRMGCSTQRSNNDWHKDAVQRAKGWKNLFDGGKIPHSTIYGRSFHFDEQGRGLGIGPMMDFNFATIMSSEAKVIHERPGHSPHNIINHVLHQGKAYIFKYQKLEIFDLSTGKMEQCFQVPDVLKGVTGIGGRLAIGGRWGYIIQQGDILRFDPNDFTNQRLFTTYNDKHPKDGVNIFKILSDGSLLVGTTNSNAIANKRILRLSPDKDQFDWDFPLPDYPTHFLDIENDNVACVYQPSGQESGQICGISEHGATEASHEIPYQYLNWNWHRLNDAEFLLVNPRKDFHVVNQGKAFVWSRTTGQIKSLWDVWKTRPLENEQIHQIELLEKNTICCLISHRTSTLKVIEEWNPFGRILIKRNALVNAYVRICDQHNDKQVDWPIPQDFISELRHLETVSLAISHDTIALSRNRNEYGGDGRSFILRYLHGPEPVVNAPIDQMALED